MLVNQGGLMRCCLESLGLYLKEHEEEDIPEGTVVHCRWCNDEHGMILENNVWRWAAPPWKGGEV